MQKSGIVAILAFSAIVSMTLALNNGLGLTPQMGWNSWNKFDCNVNENVVKETADAIVKLGLDKLGYNYVNIDDCWASGRDENKKLIADPNSFPSGIKALSDYVHAKGLKIGIYSDAGTLTCQSRPGSLYYEEIDAQTWAEWEIDYLKYDNCFNPGLPAKFRYPRMRDALNKTGRPIFYSICNQGQEDISYWAADVGNSWRTTDDINAHWDSVTLILDLSAPIANNSVIGGWNDPDMLEVGNGALTVTESKAHFALWAAMKAPLILGNDLRNIDEDTLAIISNPEIIAINQDPLGIPAQRVSQANGVEIWAGPIQDGVVAVILNRNEAEVSTKVDFNVVGFHAEQAHIRDLQIREDLGSFTSGNASVTVPVHGVRVLKLTQ